MNDALARWQHAPTGRRRYWTPERIEAALRAYIAESRGRLPNWHAYEEVKRGRGDLPPARRVCELYGAFPRAWLAAGAPRPRVPLLRAQQAWTEEEREYLLEQAGSTSMRLIGRRLHRTAGACKRMCYDLGILTIRGNSGYLNVSEVAIEYGLSLHRVYAFVRDGRLRAHRPRGVRNRWMIDTADVERCTALHAPKRTHTGTPPVSRHPRRRTEHLADGTTRRVIMVEPGDA